MEVKIGMGVDVDVQKIDVVIAWVDGNDQQHRLKRQQYQGIDIAQDAISETRFASDDEIYFSIASILKYVPYCGKIYLITDQQKPKFIDQFEQQGLCQPNQIQIIDHQQLFKGYEQVLPTFNSLTIESMLWNIPQISRYCLYLNDDFFFNAISTYDDFLKDNQIRIYGHWQNSMMIQLKFRWRQWLNQNFGKNLQPKYTIAQMLSAKMVGLNRYFEIHHRPHLLDRDVLSQFFLQHPDSLQQQIQYRFRSPYQFLPVGLNNHLKIQQQQAIQEPDVKIAYLKNQQSTENFLEDLKNPDVKFGCVQSLDQLDKSTRVLIQQALKHKFADFLPSSMA